jgi:hypothetical protein
MYVPPRHLCISDPSKFKTRIDRPDLRCLSFRIRLTAALMYIELLLKAALEPGAGALNGIMKVLNATWTSTVFHSAPA